MRKFWQVFHDRSIRLTDSHLKLPDRVVRGAGCLAGGVLDCNLAIRRAVAVLCMLFKIRVTQCILER